jgi:carbon-monoxide dehydrogenase small subunit
MTLSVTVNDVPRALKVADHQTLAEMLREQLGLTGCKIGCDQAACGACTVLVDGIPTAACATFAAMADGKSILTIEGLSPNGGLDPVQQAFADTGAVQCGFCTAGMILSTHALLRLHPDPDEATILHWLEGNICRCTGYTPIIEAIRLAVERQRAA